MQNRKQPTVALVKCSSYRRQEVEEAVSKAIELLGGFEEIFGQDEGVSEIRPESELVLKPNLLAKANPEKAVTTHPEVFRAVGKALKDAGYSNLKYGDSPGNPMLSVERTAEGCGIKTVADELGILPGDFEHGREVEYSEGMATKKFVLCNEIADLVESGEGGIINICKMKTHQLERITGAVKNSFGCVYGINKTASHAIYETPEHFARMLADLNNLVRPRLHIMDGIVAMEGNGPGSGDPTHMDVILASTDPIALDTVFCHLIYLDADYVPTNRAAMDSGAAFASEDDIRVVVGNMPMHRDGETVDLDDMAVKCGDRNFNVQRAREYRGNFRIMKLVGRFVEKKPVVLEDKCIGCGICEETCPVEGKAIKIKPRITKAMGESSMGTGAVPNLMKTEGTPKQKVAMYNYDMCIKCYCCQEMCPEKAITVQKSLLAKIIDRRWKM
ncbi:MAG: DUF362 domain-containing protein [Clostridia bacterium]|nr:DUF362 domain-containing protein [Clostridia bacterium]